MSSAANQQERLITTGWVIGFVDGEGCFTIAITKNHTTKLGWQVQPEFVVTQGEKSRESLVLIQDFFGCGRIYPNRRHDNHKEDLCRYCVKSIGELQEKIIPFFDKHPLRTAKRESFIVFRTVLAMIGKREHLTRNGLEKIARLSYQINRQKKSKFLVSSETTRQPGSKSRP